MFSSCPVLGGQLPRLLPGYATVRMLTTWHCPHLPAARLPCSSHRYLLLAGRTAANLHQRFAAGQCWDRRTTKRQMERWTDGRSPCRYINPAPHTMRALAINQSINSKLILIEGRLSFVSWGTTGPTAGLQFRSVEAINDRILYNILLFSYVQFFGALSAFSALTLLVGRQEDYRPVQIQ